MLQDERFIGEGTGPRIKPEGVNPDPIDMNQYCMGEESPGGRGYASY